MMALVMGFENILMKQLFGICFWI